MNISVLLAPYRDGFTAAIEAAVADTLEGNGHTPLLYDPHAEGFDTRKASIATHAKGLRLRLLRRPGF